MSKIFFSKRVAAFLLTTLYCEHCLLRYAKNAIYGRKLFWASLKEPSALVEFSPIMSNISTSTRFQKFGIKSRWDSKLVN